MTAPNLSEVGKGASTSLFLAGHLCCLAGFEWSRLWDFFPASFRLAVTSSVTLAFLVVLSLPYIKPQERPVLGLLLVSWCSVFAFPFVLQPVLAAFLFLGVGVGLSHTQLVGKKRLWALLAVGALAAAKLLLSIWTGLGGLLLCLGLALEVKLAQGRDPSLPPLEPVGLHRAEISWRGFAQLYAVCESGEGEKFSRKVLADTVQMVESCGGVLQSGSEHRGVYEFPDDLCRTQCHQNLLHYQEQLVDVLASVKAPNIDLIFKTL